MNQMLALTNTSKQKKVASCLNYKPVLGGIGAIDSPTSCRDGGVKMAAPHPTRLLQIEKLLDLIGRHTLQSNLVDEDTWGLKRTPNE